MTRTEFYSMLNDWNDKERKNYLSETKHLAPDYREILFSSPYIDKTLPNEIIIKEFGFLVVVVRLMFIY